MPDWNTPPKDLTTSDLGQVVIGRHTYQIRPLDYVYMALMALREEAYYPWLPIWAALQMFVPKMKQGWTFKRRIEIYSEPINPSYLHSFKGSPEKALVGHQCHGVKGTYQPSLSSAHVIPGTNESVPGLPFSKKWNSRMCNRIKAVPRRRLSRMNSDFEKIRTSLGVGNGSAEEAWTSFPVASSRNKWLRARRSAWLICRAQMANPIQGFDNWHAISANQFTDTTQTQTTSGTTILVGLSNQERQEALKNSRRGDIYQKYILAHKVGDSYRGVTNYYEYRRFLRGNIRIEFYDSEEQRFRRSDRITEQETRHLEPGGWREGPRGSSYVGTAMATAPLSTSQTVQVGSGGSATHSGPVATMRRTVPTQDDLYRQLQNWATRMEDSLNQEVGRGVIKR